VVDQLQVGEIWALDPDPALVNAGENMTVLIRANYTSSGDYTVNASVKSSTYNDSEGKPLKI